MYKRQDLTYQIIGNPVFISDLAHTILSYTKCVEIHDHIWQENVVLAHLQRNSLRQNRQVGTVHLSSSSTQRPVLVEDDYIPFPRVIKTLTHKGRAVGVLVVTAYLCPFQSNILDMVDLISSFVVPQMMRDRFLVSSDKQSVENFLITLLNGKDYSQAVSYTHLRLLQPLSGGQRVPAGGAGLRPRRGGQQAELRRRHQLEGLFRVAGGGKPVGDRLLLRSGPGGGL